MRETGAIAPNDAEREKTMRKYEVDVPENVEMADIQAIQTRIKKHNLLTVALLIPLFAGCALRESSETLGGIVFVLSIALMVLGFISGRGDEKRLPAYWAKYQQIHRMDNLPIDDVRKYLAQAGTKVDLGQMTDEEFQQFLDAHRI